MEKVSVAGVRLAAIEAGVRYQNRRDLVLIELAQGAQTAGVFTLNAFCAAPVTLARQHLRKASPRYLLINTGNANAGTGARGLADARACCDAVARECGVEPEQVLPFSTGVIGEPLPVDTIVVGIPSAHAALANDTFAEAATGIMTTDTRPKLVSRSLLVSGEKVTIAGIAKGAGMIKPNMATMLAYVFTDATLSAPTLDRLLRSGVNKSFNRITVDGDTSTNDCCLLTATGQSAATVEDEAGVCDSAFEAALEEVLRELAIEVIRDAEGATKFVTVEVSGGATSDECLRVGYAVAESPLVKTALFASDPNWGRILAAIGRAGLQELDIDSVQVRLGDTLIVANGCRAETYTEAAGQAEMDKRDITIAISLARGECAETLFTADLSHDYVSINADYRS
ncbi:MAG: bifunctional glutamate N-acetyltransferase/amino-acid acetyltransferase ArgJ [Gammaproteobacteria bacterium]|nr:bifunctional glutamate N-acetyltransferase/amino-acid acetyltransferase ArgJ [Gammaproteobacteria bacterium]